MKYFSVRRWTAFGLEIKRRDNRKEDVKIEEKTE